MALDYLIAAVFFTANQVDLVAYQFLPQKLLVEVKFEDSVATSKALVSNLEKLSKQSTKFRVCVVQKDDMYDSPLSEAIRPLLLDREKEFPSIYTSFENVNKYSKKAINVSPSKEEVMSYCLSTIPQALP
jgi:hypothetical protein